MEIKKWLRVLLVGIKLRWNKMDKDICCVCKENKELVSGYGRKLCKDCYNNINKQAEEEVDKKIEEFLR